MSLVTSLSNGYFEHAVRDTYWTGDPVPTLQLRGDRRRDDVEVGEPAPRFSRYPLDADTEGKGNVIHIDDDIGISG